MYDQYKRKSKKLCYILKWSSSWQTLRGLPIMANHYFFFKENCRTNNSHVSFIYRLILMVCLIKVSYNMFRLENLQKLPCYFTQGAMIVLIKQRCLMEHVTLYQRTLSLKRTAITSSRYLYYSITSSLSFGEDLPENFSSPVLVNLFLCCNEWRLELAILRSGE